MEAISLPKKPTITHTDEHTASLAVEGCHPGYGTTLGNAIRRVLLSSLEGTAITSVKITGITHEFTTLDGVLEDAVQIVLNLKKVRFQSHTAEPVVATLKVKRDGAVTAGDIETPSDIEVVNKDQHIATITDKKTELEMEFTIEHGIGYEPVEQREDREKEVGTIAIDAVYTPVRRVNYAVQNMRVGKRTDYEKITFDIITDGSLTPDAAFEKAVAILVEQFSALTSLVSADAAARLKEDDVDLDVADASGMVAPTGPIIENLKHLSTRTVNALQGNGILTVDQLTALTEDDLKTFSGMGAKAITEVHEALKEEGASLKEA